MVGAITNIDPLTLCLFSECSGFPQTKIGISVSALPPQLRCQDSCCALVCYEDRLPQMFAHRRDIPCIHKAHTRCRARCSNILMQSAYTFHILGLSLRPSRLFGIEAAPALGLSLQAGRPSSLSPWEAMHTCIGPVIGRLQLMRRAASSAAKRHCLASATHLGMAPMSLGTLRCAAIPEADD